MYFRYEVFLIPFLIPDNFTIAGEVNIDADITDPTTNITLHINDITIHEDEVTVTTIDDDNREALKFLHIFENFDLIC